MITDGMECLDIRCPYWDNQMEFSCGLSVNDEAVFPRCPLTQKRMTDQDAIIALVLLQQGVGPDTEFEALEHAIQAIRDRAAWEDAWDEMRSIIESTNSGRVLRAYLDAIDRLDPRERKDQKP